MELYEGAINPIGKPRRDAVMVELVNDAVIVHVECINEKNKDKLVDMAKDILRKLATN